MPVKRDKTDYLIQAVENAINVLEQFLSGKAELGITEMSRNLGLHKNNIFRILATLESKGYIEQNLNNEHYRLGIKILELGRAFLNNTGLLKVASPLLESLVQEVNENAYLGMLKKNQVFYIEHAESSQALRVASRIGTRLSPLHTAIGKAVLANFDDEGRDSVIDSLTFEVHTPNTIPDKETLLEELEVVKERGYAIDNEELDAGVTCVASPIFNYNNHVVAGISVSGPTSRLNPGFLDQEIIPKVVEYSKKISRSLGYTGDL